MGRRKGKKKFIVRPWSIAPCPTPDELRVAWAERKHSTKGLVRLLSVLAELTCHTDCSLEHLGGFGNIAGRKGGLKAYLETNVPELLPKYKSISRYVRLSYRLRQAYDIYPPAALSLLHPDLPLPKRNMPFLTNHCRKVFRDFLAEVPPTYVAYEAVVSKRLKMHRPKHAWGPPLPKALWTDEETRWRHVVIAPVARRAIAADHNFYARDYNSLMSGHSRPRYSRSESEPAFKGDEWVEGYDY